MPIYHFHLRRRNAVYEDHEGLLVSGLAEAVHEAEAGARAIMRDDPEVPAADQWIEIVDEGGNTVRTIPFSTLS